MAKSAANLIKEAIGKARNDWVDYTVTQELEIYTLLSKASNYLIAQMAKYAAEGKIPPARLGLLLNNVKVEMDRFRVDYKKVISRARSKSIDYGIISSMQGAGVALPDKFKIGLGTSFFGKGGEVHRYDPKIESYADSVWARINGQAMDALIRTKYGGITFSRRVWDATWPTERQIRDQINLAVLTGRSTAEVARQIRSYLGLPDTFRGMILKEYHPGAGVYKSAYMNSMRLAGTEINRAFTEGVFRYSATKNWITGWIWRTGSGKPCDECAGNEGEFYSKEDNPPNIPLHPFCYCWPEIQYEGG